MLQGVSLEVPQVLLGEVLGNVTLLLSNGEDLSHTLLEVASVVFVVSSLLSGFESLSLDEHGFSLLLVDRLVLGELG